MDTLARTGAVIAGAGIAGLVTALELAPRPVVVLSKRALGRGAASAWAQGGIAAAMGDDDSPELHALDTMEAGGGINDPHAVEVLTREAPQRIIDLLDLGATFDVDRAGDFALGREAAHRRRRIVHRGDATGRTLIDSLIAAARRTPSITVIENAVVRDLVAADGSIGGVVCDIENETMFVPANAVVLATGGAAALYRYTTNPLDALGDGIAIAARAGAVLADLEFVQFHPTALDCGRDPMPLVTEALRGEGAIVVDDRGDRFLSTIDPRAELAPRDIVARAVYRRRAQGRKTFIDARAVVGDAFPRRFPTVFRLCMENGIDPRSALIPIAPAAHYHMGGIAVNAWGRASLDGLWACGEVATTGVHGANRLASNSLLEALVFGVRVARDIGGCEPANAKGFPLPSTPPAFPFDERGFASLRAAMYDDAGVERTKQGLERAIALCESLDGPGVSPALRNHILVGRSIAQAALNRPESRGSHYRSDFPLSDDSFAHRSFVSAAAH